MRTEPPGRPPPRAPGHTRSRAGRPGPARRSDLAVSGRGGGGKRASAMRLTFLGKNERARSPRGPRLRPAPPFRPSPERAAGRGGHGPHASSSAARAGAHAAAPGRSRRDGGPGGRSRARPAAVISARSAAAAMGGRARSTRVPLLWAAPRPTSCPRSHLAAAPRALKMASRPRGALPASPPGPGVRCARAPAPPRPRSVAGGTAGPEGRGAQAASRRTRGRARPPVGAGQPTLYGREGAGAARPLRARREAPAPP